MRERWVTHEKTPRWIRVEGRSAIDGDVLVAYLDSDMKKRNPLWIVEYSGYVCGLNVYATKIPLQEKPS